MEDAVDRIYDAKDEGEKVLIFGDRDADGITSTTLLYQCLSDMGIDVSWRIPTGDDPYGLTLEAVEQFAADYGTLIITVDCGISNNAEIARAAELGIDVIVTDHHNPQDELPSPAIIVNPKIDGCGYPFKDLSGCGVAYKLVSALRFAKNELYKQEICLLNVRPANDSYIIEGIKIVNMAEKDRISETIVPGVVSISQTRLLPFLQGQQIFVWDGAVQKKLLAKAFGENVEFNMFDIRPDIGREIPSVANLSLLRIKDLSRIARYQDNPASELDGFFNIFITFIQKKTASFSPRDAQDLQLVAHATLADLMPQKNENRILVRQGLASINSKPRPGLLELFTRLGLLGKKLGTTDLAWQVSPVLNATGRMGQPELAVTLFLEKDPAKRDALAEQIILLNKERRQMGNDTWLLIEGPSRESLGQFSQRLVVAADERIHRGITGIMASKLVQCFKVPAVVITFLDDRHGVGSVRSTRGYDVTGLLGQCADLFTDYGGHNYAAGFSFDRSVYPQLINRLKTLAADIEFGEAEDEQQLFIDAELPHDYLSPELLKLVDTFEPYGEGNAQLNFMAKSVKIIGADLMGKTEKQHLKLTLNCGAYKWPAVFWQASDRLKRDFDIGDTVNAVFQINRNTFNGVENAQMVLLDVKKAQ